MATEYSSTAVGLPLRKLRGTSPVRKERGRCTRGQDGRGNCKRNSGFVQFELDDGLGSCRVSRKETVGNAGSGWDTR